MPFDRHAATGRALASLLGALISVVGCDGASGVDAGPPDAGEPALAAAPDIPWLESGLPCPDGWRTATVGGVAACDPYPEGGPAECAAGEAHFPGEAGCRPVGDACPTGPFADTLPTEAVIVFVDPSAGPGGDGSRGAPLSSLAEVDWAALRSGATLALSRGTHVGTLHPAAGVRIVGACAAETIVTDTPAPGRMVSMLRPTSAGEPALARNLTLADGTSATVVVSDGQSLRLEGVVIERGQGPGILVNGLGTQLFASDVVVRDTPNMGVVARNGARFEGARLVVTGARIYGVAALPTSAEVVIEDAWISATLPSEDGSFGDGVLAENPDAAPTGAIPRITASRILTSGNHRTGVGGNGATEITLLDTVARDNGLGPGEAVGLVASQGARIDAERVVVRGNLGLGVLAQNEGTISLLDAVVVENLPRPLDGRGGYGAQATLGAHLEISRTVLARNREAHVFASSGSTLVLADVVARDALPFEANGRLGWALNVDDGATVSGDRVLVDGAHEVGISAYSSSTLELRDVVVTNVRLSAASDVEYGHGIASLGGAVRLSRFRISGASTCGVMVAPDPWFFEVTEPSLDLDTGIVEAAPIGACVQVPSYDLARLTGGVEYRSNDTNLESTSLPVPEPDFARR